MQTQIRAKVRCNHIQPAFGSGNQQTSESWNLSPVYSDDPSSENHSFWKATPSGSINLQVDNPSAFGLLKQGEEYYLDLIPAQEQTHEPLARS